MRFSNKRERMFICYETSAFAVHTHEYGYLTGFQGIQILVLGDSYENIFILYDSPRRFRCALSTRIKIISKQSKMCYQPTIEGLRFGNFNETNTNRRLASRFTSR